MVLEQYAGPFRPTLLQGARAISQQLKGLGVDVPPLDFIMDAIVITAVLLLLSLLFIPLRSKDKRDTLLLVGISGESDSPSVGKTSLFTVLRDGVFPKYGTVPSMQPNQAQIWLPATNLLVNLVDYPGHPRLLYKLTEHLSRAKGIVFVVDGEMFTAQARRDAALLHDVLTNPVVANKATPVLIFINKTDAQKCAKEATVKVRLQAELDRVRTASASRLRSVGAEGKEEGEEERAFLGFENEAFCFEHAASPVSIASGSAQELDVEGILEFARSHFL
ncbi:Signal recognition particle receptor subunit beta [Gracilariopsis chorda]|uniref:Signal recognition particle receptor subunit beta n=1 Tax=Gracilariopsis chorda TaxID=448386 RepID=A0A2V3INA4_9FLOR|nr:Signal recognition particle receptor subunit beta [Gracilariopsis chorda]|eukprot:PXF43558.1 Signal recognition particle receptor subunit beta [Gracilariopsis chorda]